MKEKRDPTLSKVAKVELCLLRCKVALRDMALQRAVYGFDRDDPINRNGDAKSLEAVEIAQNAVDQFEAGEKPLTDRGGLLAKCYFFLGISQYYSGDTDAASNSFQAANVHGGQSLYFVHPDTDPDLMRGDEDIEMISAEEAKARGLKGWREAQHLNAWNHAAATTEPQTSKEGYASWVMKARGVTVKEPQTPILEAAKFNFKPKVELAQGTSWLGGLMQRFSGVRKGYASRVPKGRADIRAYDF